MKRHLVLLLLIVAVGTMSGQEPKPASPVKPEQTFTVTAPLAHPYCYIYQDPAYVLHFDGDCKFMRDDKVEQRVTALEKRVAELERWRDSASKYILPACVILKETIGNIKAETTCLRREQYDLYYPRPDGALQRQP